MIIICTVSRGYAEQFRLVCGFSARPICKFADLRADVEIESQREKLQTESTTGQCVLNVSTQSLLMHKSRQSVWFQKNHMCVSRI